MNMRWSAAGLLLFAMACSAAPDAPPRDENGAARHRQDAAALGPSADRAVRIGDSRRLLLGDSATQAPLQNANFNIQAWLDDLHARGIRTAMVWAFMAVPQTRDGLLVDRRYGYVVPDLTPWARRSEPLPAAADGGPRWDLGTFDEDVYWPRFRHLLRETARRDMTLWITLFDGWAKETGDIPFHPLRRENGGPLRRGEDFVILETYGTEIQGPFDPDWPWPRRNQWHQERFAGRVAQELDSFEHVILELFNEGEWYDARALRRHQEHFLDFLRRRVNTPLAVNADVVEGLNAWEDPRIAVVSWHTRGFDTVAISRRWLDGVARTPIKPLVNSETVPPFPEGYGETVTEEEVRRLVWTSVMSGGHVFVQDDSAFAFDPGAPDPGGAALRDQIGLATRFMDEAAFQASEFAPAPWMITGGHALAAPGRFLAYSPHGGVVRLHLPAGAYKGTWMNPRNGNRIPIQIEIPADGDEVLSTPAAGDWVLDLALWCAVHGAPPCASPASACAGYSGR